MAGKKAAGENSKKAAGNAKKADVAAQKAASQNAKQAAAEDEEWGKGAKNTAKKEADAAKKAEQARKKAEKDALLAEEEKNARAAPKNTKSATKKTSAAAAAAPSSRGLDLSRLDDDGAGAGAGGSAAAPSALNATGIDNALDALSLAGDGGGGGGGAKVDKHPERRFKAAYAAFEERRLREMEADGSGAGLRQNQRKDRVRKEFERSPENPFNQVTASYDATREDLREIREKEKVKIEKRLGGT